MIKSSNYRRNVDMDDSNIELNISMDMSTKKIDYETVV